MNHLSCLIYLAGVADDLKSLLGFLAGLCCIVVVVWAVALIPVLCADWEVGPSPFPVWKKIGYFIVPTALFMGLTCTLIPSKETVYAITASEAGEQLLKTPTANKALTAINNWLDRQAQPQPQKKDD